MRDYTDLQVKLFALDCTFRALFPNLPFCSFTANMGPQMVCNAHCDFWNLVYSTCPIGALGLFNHRMGGHIILHEPKLIIKFRRGDVMFDGEAQYSFTMYTAGGLFHYAWCGM